MVLGFRVRVHLSDSELGQDRRPYLESEDSKNERIARVVRDRVAGPQQRLAQEAGQQQAAAAGARQLPAAAVRLQPVGLRLRSRVCRSEQVFGARLGRELRFQVADVCWSGSRFSNARGSSSWSGDALYTGRTSTHRGPQPISVMHRMLLNPVMRSSAGGCRVRA